MMTSSIQEFLSPSASRVDNYVVCEVSLSRSNTSLTQPTQRAERTAAGALAVSRRPDADSEVIRRECRLEVFAL